MKKNLLAIGLGFIVATNSYAFSPLADQLNEASAALLSYIINDNTTAQMQFSEVDMDADHVLNLAFSSNYRKVGRYNTLVLKIDNYRYNYNNGLSPTSSLKGSLGFDATKMIPKDELDEVMSTGIHLIESISDQISERYRDMIVLRGVVTSTPKDAQGHFLGLSALFSLKVDIERLPEPEGMPILEGTATISLDVKKGLTFEGFVVHNPHCLSYEKIYPGLKEIIEGVIAGGEKTPPLVFVTMMDSDNYANSLVNERWLVKGKQVFDLLLNRAH